MQRALKLDALASASALGAVLAWTAPLSADMYHEDMIGGPVQPGWEETATAKDVKEDPNAPTVEYGPAPEGVGPARNVRQQPSGALSGKVVYMGAGHGWTYDDENVGTGNAWYTQRGNNNDIVEDYGNLDQMTQFAMYCFNAGATVVPTRPLGWQENEVVLDQDDGEVTYTGTWASSTSDGYDKAPDGSEQYKFVTSTVTEPSAPTATAIYTPNIPEDGFYPVYTWALDSNNRVNQQYIVNHAGGSTEVRINHRGVGKAWVWLGTYHFEAGTSGYVKITNQVESGETGNAVIADAIRFGNGLGDEDFGEGVSGFTRGEEASRYWAMENQMPASVYDLSGFPHDSDNVGTPPKFAAYVNNENEISATDAIYIGFHSNAGGGRGAVGLTNANDDPGEDTPNQTLLAELLGREINEDMRQLDTIFFTDRGYAEWLNRTTHIFDASFAYGEIRGDRLNGEMDATIIEVAFHDDADDADYLGDPLARRFTARATFGGMIRFFEQVESTNYDMLPDEPENLRAINAADGSNDVVLTWDPPTERASSFTGTTPGNIGGDSPTGYVIYTSSDGNDFEFAGEVSGGTTTSYTVSGLSGGDAVYAFVTASNGGGESFPSNVAGARASGSQSPELLIVDGFDRIDVLLAPEDTVSGIAARPNLGTFNRSIPWYTNDYSYVVPTGEAIVETSGTNHDRFDSCTNDDVIDGDVSLGNYDSVVWFAGEESTIDETVDPAEQSAIQAFLSGGGNLLISGAELGWDLGRSHGLSDAGDLGFFNNDLRATYVQDDAGTYDVVGSSGSMFDGVQVTFADGAPFYNVDFPDVLGTSNGSTGVLEYDGVPSTTGYAGLHYDGTPGAGHVFVFGFPFETITGITPLKDSNPGAVFVMQEILTTFEPTSVSDWMLMDK